jgi:hypothetical protein
MFFFPNGFEDWAWTSRVSSDHVPRIENVSKEQSVLKEKGWFDESGFTDTFYCR